MIYCSEPTDWKNLQYLVASIFREIGCETFTEKEINTLRGKVEVDVYAKDNQSTPESLYICECKFWSYPVPKNVVHAFRTVITDSGANHGYIISKKGFQSGAHDAALNSNITLRTWNEFQEEFLSIGNQASIDKLHSKLREIEKHTDSAQYSNSSASEYTENTKKD
jgi:Restriction endonuclease